MFWSVWFAFDFYKQLLAPLSLSCTAKDDLQNSFQLVWSPLVLDHWSWHSCILKSAGVIRSTSDGDVWFKKKQPFIFFSFLPSFLFLSSCLFSSPPLPFPPLPSFPSFLSHHLNSPLLFLLHTACGILVFPLGIKPGPSLVETQSLHYWPAREVSTTDFLRACFPVIHV